MKYLVVIEKTETGYAAHSPDILGCTATGGSAAEAGKNMREALEIQLGAMRRKKNEMPKALSRFAYFEYDTGGASGAIRQKHDLAVG